MKKLFFILFVLIAAVSFGQPYTYHLRYDTVKFTTANNSEFVLRSSTRDTTNGLLLNIGGGITQFIRIRAISATQFTVGTDTITITGSGGGGGGSGTVTNVASGFGLSGGPITITGTLFVDTSNVTSWLSRIKLGDSLGLLIAGKAALSHTHIYSDLTDFPAQSGQGGKYLTTDGSLLSWGTVSVGTTETASGGLEKVVNDIRLGGSALLANTSVPTSAFSMTFNSSTSSSGTLVGVNTSSAPGLSGTSNSGYGIYGLSTSSYAIGAVSTDGIGLLTAVNPSTTNTVVPIIQMIRWTSGTAANGIGGYIDFMTETSDGSTPASNRIYSKWTDATTATSTSLMEFWGRNSNTLARKMAIAGTGQLTLDTYGSGTHTGTAAKWLAVTSAGLVIEEDPPAGGGGVWGAITGTIGDQTDLASALALKAPLASPTFTGTVTIPTPFTLGAVSVLPTGTELNFVDGVTSAIQTQIDGKQATLVSGTNIKTLNGATLLGSGDLPVYDDMFLLEAALGSNLKAYSFPIQYSQNATTRAVADGVVNYFAIYLKVGATLTGAKFMQAIQGNFVGDNTNAIGLYTYSAGTLTKVAETANSEAIWESTGNTMQTVAFTSTYAAAAGVYYLAFLRNSSSETTAPTVASKLNTSTGSNGLFTNSAALCFSQTAQATLPASVATTSLTVLASVPWGGVY